MNLRGRIKKLELRIPLDQAKPVPVVFQLTNGKYSWCDIEFETFKKFENHVESAFGYKPETIIVIEFVSGRVQPDDENHSEKEN